MMGTRRIPSAKKLRDQKKDVASDSSENIFEAINDAVTDQNNFHPKGVFCLMPRGFGLANLMTAASYLRKNGFVDYGNLRYRDYSSFSDVDFSLRFAFGVNSFRVFAWSLLFGGAITAAATIFAVVYCAVTGVPIVHNRPLPIYPIGLCLGVFCMMEVILNCVLIWYWRLMRMVYVIIDSQVGLKQRQVRIAYGKVIWMQLFLLPITKFNIGGSNYTFLFKEVGTDEGVSLVLEISVPGADNCFVNILTTPMKDFKKLRRENFSKIFRLKRPAMNIQIDDM